MANVTPQEQLMLELINRARLNPLAEAARLGLDLNEGLTPGTITSAPKAPLAMNDLLVASSRAHSAWMLDADVFSHTGQGGSSAGQRMTAAGYGFTGAWSWGENISWTGSSGAIDLSSAIAQQHDSLFRSPGHRTNIISDGFVELGVGQLAGQFLANGVSWNASMVTQNFARSGSDRFITGVVYTDSVNDDRYGIGEGVGGVMVSASGRSDVSSAAGGYELALPAGAHSVSIGGVTLGIALSSQNVKVDLVNGREIWTNASVTMQAGSNVVVLIGIEAASVTGSGSDEWIVGNIAANALSGGAGRDGLTGAGGNDTLNGGPGLDVSVHAGARAAYGVQLGATTTVTDLTPSRDGVDTLVSIERLRFSDGTLALDTALPGQGESNAGSAFRLYEAAFNRTPDNAGLAFWIKALDGGVSTRQAAQGFVDSLEFRGVYGTNPTAQQLVTGFYNNILGRAPEQAGYDFWFGILNNNPAQRAAVLDGIANSQENQAGLIGTIGQGIWLPGDLLV